jgi:hypothetical protein
VELSNLFQLCHVETPRSEAKARWTLMPRDGQSRLGGGSTRKVKRQNEQNQRPQCVLDVWRALAFRAVGAAGPESSQTDTRDARVESFWEADSSATYGSGFV